MKISAWMLDRPETKREVEASSENLVGDMYVHEFVGGNGVSFIQTETACWRVEAILDGCILLTKKVTETEARREIAEWEKES